MALKSPELRVTFEQEPWSSHEIDTTKTKIPFLIESFIQKYPKYDVNNVPLPDIVGPTSYLWYTWSTSVKEKRDEKRALGASKRNKVGKWEFGADERFSE